MDRFAANHIGLAHFPAYQQLACNRPDSDSTIDRLYGRGRANRYRLRRPDGWLHANL